MLDAARFVRNLFSSNEERRLAAANVVVRRLLPGYPMTWPQVEWFGDPDFTAYLERFRETRGFNAHRRWMVWQLLRLTAFLPGDTAECGVFHGAGSWLICAANAHRPMSHRHHLFDSFQGLSAPGSQDGQYWREGALSVGEREVSRNLLPFAERIELHKGWIPERFPDVEGKSFSFVHIDVDLYQPTLDSIAFFYDRLEPGAVLVCDDYACSTCPGATRAISEFLEDKPEKMLRLDAGGGFMIKGVPTARESSPMRGVGPIEAGA